MCPAPRSSAPPRAPPCSRIPGAPARGSRAPAGRGRRAAGRGARAGADAAERRRGEPSLLPVCERLEEADPLALGEGLQAGERRIANPASRPVGDAEERDGVDRVVEHLEVRDDVLDLRALVEARPADHLVRDALPNEHVLEHAGLRVRPVEDRDLPAGAALLDERRNLRRHEPRLRVLVLELDDLDGVAVAERTRGSWACARGCARSPSSRPGGSSSSSGSSARGRSCACP